jgi:uncharacterized protein (TIGR03084 family)
VRTADLDAATPAQGWSVRDTVAHLHGTDLDATVAAGRPEEFVAGLARIPDVDDFVEAQVRRLRAAPALLDDWQRAFEAMLTAFAAVPAGTRIPWYGPPMSPASFATARLMEYWAHGQDVADALGAVRPPTARLRHVAHLGVHTRRFAYVNRGLAPDPAPVAVELTAPDGSTWLLGDAGADSRVTGPALDFCLLVTQRRHRHDLSLVATGPAADTWLDLAQCFAGPPGAGRPPLEDPR